MNPLRQILASLMVALLVPASSCCVLASVMHGVSYLEHQHFAADHHHHHHDYSGDDEQEDSDHAPTTCVAELLNHSTLSLDIDLPQPCYMELAQTVSQAFQQDPPKSLAVPIEHPSTAPPGLLLPAWHFQQRTALLARAPTLA